MMQIYHFLGYIDPGTGSMLFTIIIGIVTTLFFVLRGVLIKFKYTFGSGKQKEDKDKLPIVIFSDSKRYWNVFKPICDELEARGADAEYWTASPDDPALSEQYQHIVCRFIGEGNKSFARLNIMNAYICLATTPGLDVLQWKRSKDVAWYVHTYHAVGDNLGYRMFGLDYYDAVLETGDVQTRGIRTLEKLRELPAKELTIVGSVTLDRLKKKAEEIERIPNETPVILLAPSWGESSILNRFGSEFIRALKDTGYRIIIRPHPQSSVSEKELLEKLMAEFPDGDMLEWNYDNDNFKVLARADLMISDYSGVIFDYVFIFDKPIMYADVSLDRAPYDSAWVDYVPWTLDILSSLGKKLDPSDIDHMKQIVDEVMASDIYRDGRAVAREEAWQYQGQAAEKTVDYLLGKLEELKK